LRILVLAAGQWQKKSLMFTSIWDDIKQQFSHGNTLTRIILVNIAVFVLLTIVRLVLMPVEDGITYDDFLHFFTISSNGWHNLTHPWVLITHMFVHEQFFHILWNMLLLYWFGRIVGDLLGDQRILPIYLMSGVAGGLMYFAMSHVFTSMSFGGYALGASAAFMGMIVVAGMAAPAYIISLLFLGDVRLKFIVGVLVLLDLVAISWNSNTGGSFGHLGGAAMGYVIATQLQHGNDMTAPVNQLIQNISSFFKNLFTEERPKPKMAYKNPNFKREKQYKEKGRKTRSRGQHKSDGQGLSHQERVDAILDKIKQSGYNSLSSEEKEFLFNASKK